MSRLSPPRPGSSGKHLPPVPTGRQWKIFVTVSLLHVLLIFGPLAYLGWRGAHQEENAFRVKLGGPDLSHDWNVGKPERLRPGANPGRLPDPPPTEPDTPEPPPQEPARPDEPGIDVVRLQQQREARERAAAEAAKKKAAAEAAKKKAAAEAARKKAAEAAKKKAAEAARKRAAEAARKKAAAEAAKRKAAAEAARKKAEAEARRRRELEGVYNPNRTGPIGDGSGRNTNQNVPIGSQDRGQAYGKPDYRTPGGGASSEIPDSYFNGLKRYFDARWQQPPRSLLGNNDPKVVVELTVSDTGKVLASRIISRSGINAMDESVKRLLDNLDLVPRPPSQVTFQLVLKVE